MPQLNPAPWFLILMFSWLVFVTIIPPKVLKHTFPNDPALMSTETPTPNHWNWPWS
uniref:ATP synthase complex subunit 8 n=1 Tax=Phractolaemus ansorgii TaxID=169291 RepID=Q2A0D9_9TELE|nr:ATP synthase F0 subunit 8 [Phractolaemus ansorgii]BAE79998.1 ATPase subunits 8 [Phractolaemus ansorgii]BAF74013.1 ATPase subunit 8 [Phractolaemus ansorgii]